MMHSHTLKQKRSTTEVKSFKDVRKATSSRHATKNSLKIETRKKNFTKSNNVKRYTKRAFRSILLSPIFHSTFKIIVVAVVSAGLIYASYFFIGKTFANEVVVSQSEIVSRVSKLTTLPGERPYDVVRVQDGNDLRTQNPFYKDVKEGDYILVYENLAVIYDLRNNAIIGIKRTNNH